MKTSKQMLRDLRKTHYKLETNQARLLAVAGAFKEYYDFEEKFINDPSVSLSDVDAKKQCALAALAAVEDLLSEDV